MQFLNTQLVNILIFIFGFLGLILILIYTAFSAEESTEEEE